MADQQSNQTLEAPDAQNPTDRENNGENNSYWCYQCNKVVNLEPHEEGSPILCSECHSGFVEARATAEVVPNDHRANSRARRQRSGRIERGDSTYQRNVLRVLRMLTELTQSSPRIQRARVARDGTLGETRSQGGSQLDSQEGPLVVSQQNIGHLQSDFLDSQPNLGYTQDASVDNESSLGQPQTAFGDNQPNFGHSQAAFIDNLTNLGNPQSESNDNHTNLGHPQAESDDNQADLVPADASENGNNEVIEASDFLEEGNEEDDDNVLNIELDMWDSFGYDDDDEDDDDGDEEDEEENDAWEEVGEGDTAEGQGEEDAVDVGAVLSPDETNGAGVEGQRRPNARRDVLRLRIRDWTSLSRGATLETSGRTFDWNEIMQGLEDNTIELRLSLPEEDTYVGNPADYVDDAGYEILLQNFAENDNTHRGAPPAAKSAIEGLPAFEICQEEIDSGAALCAICKDMIPLGDTGKQLPCQHLYHGDCIIPWLSSRNSCPICRYELPTDDADYEEQKKQRTVIQSTNSDSGMASSNGSLS